MKFKVYLPMIHKVAELAHTSIGSTTVPRGSETILVVDDEPLLQLLIKRMLESQGYTVLTTQDGPDSLRMIKEHNGTIHLLITDVLMPEMSGQQLAEQIAVLKPEISVLYISGYSREETLRHGILQAGAAFLPKPFMPHALAFKVRAILDNTDIETYVE